MTVLCYKKSYKLYWVHAHIFSFHPRQHGGKKSFSQMCINPLILTNFHINRQFAIVREVKLVFVSRVRQYCDFFYLGNSLKSCKWSKLPVSYEDHIKHKIVYNSEMWLWVSGFVLEMKFVSKLIGLHSLNHNLHSLTRREFLVALIKEWWRVLRVCR